MSCCLIHGEINEQQYPSITLSSASIMAEATAVEPVNVSVLIDAGDSGAYKSLAERALLAGACVGCALRFNGCWNPASFQSPWQTLLRAHPGLAQCKRDREADASEEIPCTVCLGILQQAISDTKENAQHVAACVDKENRKFSYFGVAVQIPMECVIRDRCMWEYLRGTKPSANNAAAGISTTDSASGTSGETDTISCHQSVPGIRDALRYILLPSLEEVLGVPSRPGAGVELLLTYTHHETLNDWIVLKSIEPSVFRERRQKSRKPWHRQSETSTSNTDTNESGQPTLPQVEKCLEAAANKYDPLAVCMRILYLMFFHQWLLCQYSLTGMSSTDYLYTFGEKETPCIIGHHYCLNLACCRATCKHRGIAQYISCPPAPVKTLSAPPHVVGTHEPVYVAGRYTKHSRVVSQSPWFMDDGDEGGSGDGGIRVSQCTICHVQLVLF